MLAKKKDTIQKKYLNKKLKNQLQLQKISRFKLLQV